MLRSSCGSRPLSAPKIFSAVCSWKSAPFAERVDEHRILGEVREHAELDLRVVGRDQHVARVGDEGAADLAAERRADRNVLQVRIAAAQPAGGGDRLVEAGVDAAGLGVHQLRQRVDVGALQLHQRAPLENLPRQIVGQRQLLEHLDGRRRRADVPVRFSTGSCSLSNRISASCFGELMLNSPPASSKICAVRCASSCSTCCDCAGERRAVDRGRRRARWRPAPAPAAARASGRPRSAASLASRSRSSGASWPARSARSPA